jgi:hypothetical protein
MTAFLGDNEIGQIVPDKEVQACLEEVRRRTGKNWQVVRHTYRKRQGWFRSTEVTVWELYLYVGGVGPWQVINFRNPDPEGSSIYHAVDLGFIAAYLYGILVGLDCGLDNAAD